MKSIEHILVATDFGPISEGALDAGLTLASHFGAKLTVLHALETPAYAYPFPIPGEVRRAARTALDATVATARARVAATDGVLREGVAWEAIVSAAKDLDADLVVIGSRGRRGLPRWLLGSVAERVLRMSPVPVLTVHG